MRLPPAPRSMPLCLRTASMPGAGLLPRPARASTAVQIPCLAFRSPLCAPSLVAAPRHAAPSVPRFPHPILTQPPPRRAALHAHMLARQPPAASFPCRPLHMHGAVQRCTTHTRGNRQNSLKGRTHKGAEGGIIERLEDDRVSVAGQTACQRGLPEQLIIRTTCQLVLPEPLINRTSR